MSVLAPADIDAPPLLVEELEVGQLAGTVAAAMQRGERYLTSAAADERSACGRFRVDHVFGTPGQMALRVLRIQLPATHPGYPSLTPVLPAVHWDERQHRDLFGITPRGHPDPRRLVLPDDWPADLHPLRKDVPWDVHPPSASGWGWAPRVADAEGVVRLPVGPVHAGIIESGHFAFSLMGETILHLDLRLFQKHRGVEKVLEGKRWQDVAESVERTCAACSASHQAAWCQALEGIVGWPLPPRAVGLRTIVLECERLYNHIHDIAAVPAGTGFAVAAMEGAELKERFLRWQAALFGHRYLFGSMRPGGVCFDLPAEEIPSARGDLAELRSRLDHLERRLWRHPGFTDRLDGVGVLSRQVARDLGAVGPSARATGIAADLRVDHPYLAYRWLEPQVVTEAAGDVAARLRVRFREAAVSFALLDGLLHRLPGGRVRTDAPPGADQANGLGVGSNESPRGANVHYVELRSGRVARYRIRSAAFANWPLLMDAVPGNVIGDFPLINKSFELCYACCDG